MIVDHPDTTIRTFGTNCYWTPDYLAECWQRDGNGVRGPGELHRVDADVLERENPLPPKLWTWIKERDDEHWPKTPYLGERFETLLVGSPPASR